MNYFSASFYFTAMLLVVAAQWENNLHVLRIDSNPCEIDDSFRELVEGSGIYVKAEAFSSPEVTDGILESPEISDIMLKGFIRKDHKDTGLFRLSISNKHKTLFVAGLKSIEFESHQEPLKISEALEYADGEAEATATIGYAKTKKAPLDWRFRDCSFEILLDVLSEQVNYEIVKLRSENSRSKWLSVFVRRSRSVMLSKDDTEDDEQSDAQAQTFVNLLFLLRESELLHHIVVGEEENIVPMSSVFDTMFEFLGIKGSEQDPPSQTQPDQDSILPRSLPLIASQA